MSAVDPGLCASCARCRRVESARGSTFFLCEAPGLPKYPPLPVRACAQHEPIGPHTAGARPPRPRSSPA
ncbi:MAG: hypothetical protein M5U28_20990 [Sandaracinaceae bacterium]|nr:hypothetical protein [Sandaracinaceae bacterium]